MKDQFPLPLINRQFQGTDSTTTDTGTNTKMSEADQETRPWFMGPLPGLVLLILAIVALLHDGLTPWRILYKRYFWKKTPAMPTMIEVPYRHIVIRSSGAKDIKPLKGASPMSGRRSADKEEVKDVNPSKAVPGEYVKYQVRPRQIKVKYIDRGTLFKRKEKRFFVSLAYSYRFKGKVFKIDSDSPPFSFSSQQDALDFLGKKTRQWPIDVWVNPSEPAKATAFLDYDGWFVIRLGGAMIIAGLLWLMFTMASGSSGTETEGKEKPAAGTGRAQGRS